MAAILQNLDRRAPRGDGAVNVAANRNFEGWSLGVRHKKATDECRGEEGARP